MISADRLSADTRKKLGSAGWTPAHRREPDALRRAWTAAGHPAHEPAVSLLETFGDLRVPILHHIARDADTFHLELARVLDATDPETVQTWARRIGAGPLCPIGEVFSDHAVLLMDARGRVFAAFEDAILTIADSGPAALDALCSGQPLPPFQP